MYSKYESLILGLIVLPSLAYATHWPMFAAPDKEFLLANNYLTEKECPIGQVRLVSQPVINIHQSLCKTFCPTDWEWIGDGDGQCHEMKDVNFKNYQISHIYGDAMSEYSIVTANYGENNAFKFTFTSKADEHWHCIEGSTENNFIVCANDM